MDGSVLMWKYSFEVDDANWRVFWYYVDEDVTTGH
jgi:hypothetical protein